jgi:hypothetical protein
MTNWSLELDQWVGLIVVVSRHGFAIRAEVCVGTNSAFVSVALDVRLAASVRAKRTIAIDAAVDLSSSTKIGDWLVQSRKPMARVNLIGAKDACRAEVPVWTFQALVSHSSDVLKGEGWSANRQRGFCAVYRRLALSHPSQIAWCTTPRPDPQRLIIRGVIFVASLVAASNRCPG